MKKIKIILLYMLKYLGLFHLMRWFNRRKLCILGYHGISLRDENIFQPTLFMSENFFHRRMNRLSKLGYPIIPLDEAVNGLKNGSLPDNAVVVTFDDGWEGVFSRAVPILRKYNFPATIYIMSHNVEQKIPVLDVFLRYVLWKSTALSLDLGKLGEKGLSGVRPLDSPEAKKDMFNKLYGYLEQELSIGEGYNFIERICRILAVDWEQLQSDRMFRLAPPEMITECSKFPGIDMELHTHHHIFPETSYKVCQQEIMENQQKLLNWTGKKPGIFAIPVASININNWTG